MQNNHSEKNIYVTRPSMPSKEEYFEEVSSLWETGILTHGGAKHQLFENQLKEMMDAPHVSLFTNGHQGLEAVFSTLEPQGEVITTPFTFVSTTLAIARAGLIPVFCDVKADDYTLDPSKIEALVTDKTVAIVPVHVYGTVCDVEAIDAIAKKHGLKVIYDAAHAFGEKLNGSSIALYGDASMFSFHATKVLNTGEGGAVVCNDEEIKKKMDAWKYYGFESSGSDVELLGTNAKMTEFAAAMGLCNLRHFDEELSKRATVFNRYRERLENVEGVRLCDEQSGVFSNHAYLPVSIDSSACTRDEVVDRMNKDGIFPRKYFYPLTSEYSCFGYLGNSVQETPVSFKASRSIMTLPMYADLSTDDVDRVCTSLISAIS